MRNESPVTNWEPPMSEKGLDESYAVIREALEKNNRGNVVNSLQNCVLALTHDPLLGGHIRRNLSIPQPVSRMSKRQVPTFSPTRKSITRSIDSQ